MLSIQCAIILCALIAIPGAPLVAQTTVVVGEGGQVGWDADSGPIGSTATLTLPTVIFETPTGFGVDQTNAPGGVVEFTPPDFPGWIFPTQADSTQNILLGLTGRDRGGTIKSPSPSAEVRFKSEYEKLIDDDGTTAMEVRASSSAGNPGALGLIIQFDFNALFAVNRIRFFPRNAADDYAAADFPFQNDFLKGYEIFWDDGSPEQQLNGQPIWPTLVLNGDNTEAVVDLTIPARFIRQLRLKSLTSQPFELAEFQVFAEGFVPEARYISSVFDFGDPALMGNLRWLQASVGDSVISDARIRTRTGIDADPVEFTRPGVQSIGLVEVGRTTSGNAILEDIPITVPWKRAEDVEDDELRSVIARLDDDALTGAEALLQWTQLPLDLRAQITMNESEYNSIDNVGPVRNDLTNWSAWSPPYSSNGRVALSDDLTRSDFGTPILSPSPRRYFQFTIEFSSRSFDAATGIGSLGFDVSSTALADTIIGEVFPRQTEVGVSTSFTYAVLVRDSPRTAGFDQLEIRTPIRVEAIKEVTMEIPGEPQQSADFSAATLETLPVVGEGGFVVSAVEDDRFLLSLPSIDADGALVTVNFEAAVLRFGTIFTGRAFNSELGTIGQEILPGNAADLGRGDLPDPDVVRLGVLVADNLTVQLPVTNNLLVNVRAVPSVLTPNDDDVNDETLIKYDITNVSIPARVEIELFDLSGRRVLTLIEERASGRHEIAWDGTDEGGTLVAPGNYVLAISLRTNAGDERALAVVAVTY